MGQLPRDLNDLPAMNGPGSIQEAVKAFASSYGRHAGTHCEVLPWPGGREENHDADAILLIHKNKTKLRVLLEATEVFQGPITHFGSPSERFLRNLRRLEQDMMRLLPSDCSLTIYWRKSVRQMLDRPAGDSVRRQFTTTLLQVVTDQCHTASLGGSALAFDDEVPGALRPWIRTIATVRSGRLIVKFRYPLQTKGGITHYSEIPLATVGVSPADVDAAIVNKLGLLSGYRQRARAHHADQVWLLVVASGQSAASTLSPLSFVEKISTAFSSLRIEPNFDAIYLLAHGDWARVDDPLGPTDEWLLVPLPEGRWTTA